MKQVLVVRFKKTGKLCYLNPLKFGFRTGDMIIADTERGSEMGRIVKIIDEDAVPKDVVVQDILKPATRSDMIVQKENEEKAKEVVRFCKEEAKNLKLKMKVLTAEYTFDLSRLTIYFSAEERIDFRELVKVLANQYKTRIELRQVGPRDEVKVYPNLGICGREVCCRSYLQELDPIVIKMAKEQGLQINMSKLSGACGRLKCCLRYEEEVYKENQKKLPKIGQIVNIGKEQGKVISVDILQLKVRVKIGTTKDDERYDTYPVDMLSWKKEN